MVKSISILGCTGSIGRQTIAVAEHIGMPVAALTANRKIDMLEEQARRLHPKFVAVYDETAAKQFKVAVADTDIRVGSGMDGLIEAACMDGTDCVVTAVSGSVGLRPTLAAIDAKKRIALANKETLVCAGDIVMARAKEKGAEIVPVDSEHSAIFQCLMGRKKGELKKILLTGSGGPFRGKARSELEDVTPEQAVKHPNWSMGAKITIDSASMMNKGLEIIEAHHLYGLPLERIGVLVHPQSLVHSLVEFEDGSLMAQAGTPDMRMPIAYCLAWPLCLDAGVPPLDLARSGALTFEEPDLHSFPCLELACRTIGKGSALPVALNAANEVAVEAFLSGRIGFMDIPDIIGRALDECSAPDPASLEAIETLDHETRLRVGLWIEKV